MTTTGLDTTSFRVRCWGARGTCPSPGPHTVRYGGHTACLEVRANDGTLIVLDAGTGIRGLGKHLQTSGDTDAAHLFLTHRHGDHVIGLPHFAPLFRGDRALFIACGNADATTTRALVDTLLSPPLFPAVTGAPERLLVRGFTNGTPSDLANGCVVHRFDAQHPGGAAIFRVDGTRGPALAFAPDNELDYERQDPAHVAWRTSLAKALRDVPMLVHDATYTDDELRTHQGWGHSSALEATRFAMECNAGMLVLFHHHPDRADEALDLLVQECRDVAGRAGSSLRVLAAWEGLDLAV